MRPFWFAALAMTLGVPALAQRPPVTSTQLPPLQQQWQQDASPPVQQAPVSPPAVDQPSLGQIPPAAAGPVTMQRPNVWLPADVVRVQALDKVNAQAATLTIKVGESATFGSLTITAKACVKRPLDQPADAAAYLTVTDSHPDSPGFAGLMLDMDGTLIDLAATPDAVVVQPGLTETLALLRDGLGGALAIVTGRPVETVDRLFGNAPGAVAGEHGGAVRHGSGQPIERVDLPAPPESWLRTAEAVVGRYPGALLERKARGFALHYRQAPEARDVFYATLRGLIDTVPAFELHPAHMLWEVRPRGADKGGAVIALMQRAPFAGRLPIFIGDDVTDEDGMRAARERGGSGYRVDAVFKDPDGVRDWLRRSAERGDWAALP